jgi:hypothetical protein
MLRKLVQRGTAMDAFDAGENLLIVGVRELVSHRGGS